MGPLPSIVLGEHQVLPSLLESIFLLNLDSKNLETTRLQTTNSSHQLWPQQQQLKSKFYFPRSLTGAFWISSVGNLCCIVWMRWYVGVARLGWLLAGMATGLE